MNQLNNEKKTKSNILIISVFLMFLGIVSVAQPPVAPPKAELNRSFGKYDTEALRKPSQVYHPQTWFHYIGGNVSKDHFFRFSSLKALLEYPILVVSRKFIFDQILV